MEGNFARRGIHLEVGELPEDSAPGAAMGHEPGRRRRRAEWRAHHGLLRAVEHQRVVDDAGARLDIGQTWWPGKAPQVVVPSTKPEAAQ